MFFRRFALIALAFAVSAGATFWGAPAFAEPELRVRDSGRIVVRWEGRCVVRYTARGDRSSAEQACSQTQRSRSDDMVRRHLRTASSGGGGGTGGGPNFVERSGRTEAVYDDGCRVFYDEDGKRTDSNRACTPAQVERADERLRAVWSRPSGAGRPIGKPVVDDRSRYMTQLLYPDGCNVNFDRDGNRTGTSGPCTRAHREQADRDYRAAQR